MPSGVLAPSYASHPQSMIRPRLPLPFHISLFHRKPPSPSGPGPHRMRGNNKADRPITALGTHSGSLSAVPTNRLVPRPQSLRAFTIFIPKTVFEASDIPPPTKRVHETRISNFNSASDSIASTRHQVKSDAAIDLSLSLFRHGLSSTSVVLSTHPSPKSHAWLLAIVYLPHLTSPHLTSLHFTSPLLF
jgi:hypothetical protein